MRAWLQYCATVVRRLAIKCITADSLPYHSLTHYTSEKGLVGILENGFAWVPNRRRLADVLLPQHDYSRREPQQFGMISFTELRPREASAHQTRFGRYGIVVTREWARKHGAQRVMYISGHGAVTDALRNIFAVGYDDLVTRIRFPDDRMWQMAFENKNVAGAAAGATLWANVLTLWEYLEPEESCEQREWRIVNPLPDYSLQGPTSDIIAAVSPPAGWATITRVIKLAPADVEALVCPIATIGKLRAKLPRNYEHSRLVSY